MFGSLFLESTLVDNLGHPGGLVQHTFSNKTNPTNPSVRTGIGERLPHPRLPQQTLPNRTRPTNHTGRSFPHPFHKGERGGEVVDDPCQPLTHSYHFLPEGKSKGMATCHHLVVRPFPKRMDNVALPLPFPFGKEGERVSQRRARIVDHFPSLFPCLERDGEMEGWWLGWVSPVPCHQNTISG